MDARPDTHSPSPVPKQAGRMVMVSGLAHVWEARMAKRVLDGPRLYAEPWDHLTRDLFVWLVLDGADSLGMLPERTALMAGPILSDDELLPIEPRRIREALEVLTRGEKPTLIRYESGGQSYLIFRKWQDHQSIRHPFRPTCPRPSDPVFWLLSVKQADLLRRNYAASAREQQPDAGESTARGRPSVSVSVKEDKGLKASTTDSAEMDRYLARFYRRYEEVMGKPPQTSALHDPPLRALIQDRGIEAVADAWDAYLANPWWRERGCPMQAFLQEKQLARFLNGEAPRD